MTTTIAALCILALLGVLGNWKTIKWELRHGLAAVILWIAAIFVFGVIVLGLFVFAIHQL
jgi:hypothetical protein